MPLRPMPLIAVLNGPNINMLGSGYPHYRTGETLDDVETLCVETAEALDLAIDFRQSNHEGELVSWIQEFRARARGLVLNPAGYAASAALVDAILASNLITVEVHIENTHRREAGRRSRISAAATGVISGLGIGGYALALTAVASLLQQPTEPT